MEILCKLCDLPCFADNGAAKEETLTYQRIAGEFHLAKEVVLNIPLIFIHVKCIKEVSA